MDENKGRNNVGQNAEIDPNARMRGYIDIKGFGVRDLLSDITVGRHDSIEIESEFEIDYKSNSMEFDSDITVAQRDKSEISTELFIYPNARMRGLADIIEAPKKVVKIYPSKDSTVREAAPILNYGKSSQMMAGKEATGKLMSYLGFTLEWPEDLDELITAKLVLNKEYPTDKAFFMGIFETNDDWLEDYITWSYRPTENRHLSQFPIPKDAGRVEVDITDFASSWAEVGGSKSFTLQPRNYDFSELTTFSTRESNEPPYIEITYYEIPANANAIGIDTEMQVVTRVGRALPTTIEVLSDFNYGELQGEILIDSNEVDSSLDTEIVVSVDDISGIDSAIEMVTKNGESYISHDVIVPYTTELDVDLNIVEKKLSGEIDSEIVIKAFDTTTLAAELETVENYVDKELDTEIQVKRHTEDDLISKLETVENYVDKELDVEIQVKQTESSELKSELTIESKSEVSELHTDIHVGRGEFNDLETEIGIDAKYSEIEIESSINVRASGTKDLNTIIEVPKVDGLNDLDIEFILPYLKDLDTDIEIEDKYRKYEIETIMDLNRKNSESDISVDMHVKAFWAEEMDMSIIIERKFEIDVELEVRASGGDYAFII